MRYTIITCFLLVTIMVNAQYKNQLEYAKKFVNGNYTVYRNDLGKLDKLPKLWPLSIVYDASGLIEKVVIKRAGVVEEEFTPDLKEAPGYFNYEDYKLIFFDDYAVYFKQTRGQDKLEYDVTYEFIVENGKPRRLDEAKEDIIAYRASALKNQSIARADISKNKEAAEAKEKEENSTKGKNVKSLTFKAVDIPANIGHYTKIQFGIIATLQDGKELKTKNLGGKTDFEYSYDVTAPGCSFADGTLEVADDASQFPNDEIVVTIKNLNSPSQSIQQKITLTYNTPIYFGFPGETGRSGFSGNNGGSNNCDGKPGTNGNTGLDGKDLNIKLVEVKHKKNNTKIFAVEISKAGDDKIYKYKIEPSAQVTINIKGGTGGDGGSGGRISTSNSCKNGISRGGNGGEGGMGGRGGNVNITKANNNASTSFLNINNKGGNGGKGGSGGSGAATGSNGKQGNDGKLNVVVAPVQLSW